MFFFFYFVSVAPAASYRYHITETLVNSIHIKQNYPTQNGQNERLVERGRGHTERRLSYGETHIDLRNRWAAVVELPLLPIIMLCLLQSSATATSSIFFVGEFPDNSIYWKSFVDSLIRSLFFLRLSFFPCAVLSSWDKTIRFRAVRWHMKCIVSLGLWMMVSHEYAIEWE